MDKPCPNLVQVCATAEEHRFCLSAEIHAVMFVPRRATMIDVGQSNTVRNGATKKPPCKMQVDPIETLSETA